MTDTTVPTDLLDRLSRADEHAFTQAELEPLREQLTAWLIGASRIDTDASIMIANPGGWPLSWMNFAEHLREQSPRARFIVHTDGTGRVGVLDTLTRWTAWGLHDYDAANLNEDPEAVTSWTWTDPDNPQHEAWGDNYQPIIDAAREVATRPYDFDTALNHPEDAAGLTPLRPAYTVWMRDERGRAEDNVEETWQSVLRGPSRYVTHLSLFRNWLGDHPEHVPTITGAAATQAESKPLAKWQELGFISEEAYAAFSRKVAETANRLRKCEEADAFVTELGLIPRQEMTRTQTVTVEAFTVTVEVPFTAGAVHFAADSGEIGLRIRDAINRHITEQVLPRRHYTVADPEFIAPRY